MCSEYNSDKHFEKKYFFSIEAVKTSHCVEVNMQLHILILLEK
jgi:hypothetical protein